MIQSNLNNNQNFNQMHIFNQNQSNRIQNKK